MPRKPACEPCGITFANMEEKVTHRIQRHDYRPRRLNGQRVRWCTLCGIPFGSTKARDTHYRLLHVIHATPDDESRTRGWGTFRR